MMLLQGLTLLLASVTQAVPYKDARRAADTAIASRQEGTGIVIMCTEVNWTGDCIYQTVNLGYDVCTSLSAPWLYNVSSFEPEYGTVCWLNHDTDCQDLCMDPEGCDMIVEFPGYGNLSEYGYPPWTDRIGSFTCELSN